MVVAARIPSEGVVRSLGKRGFAVWRNVCDCCTGIPPLVVGPPSRSASRSRRAVDTVQALGLPVRSGHPLAGDTLLSLLL